MEWFDAKTATVNPWQSPAPVVATPRPDYADSEDLKQSFGIALGRGLNAFDAGLEVMEGSTPKALWVSTQWVNDPIVIAAKDAYLKSLKKLEKPLDKEQLLAEVLEAARLAPEDRDRAAFFKLYSEIAGFTGKQVIDASTNNFSNNTSNYMQIKLVGGSDRAEIPNAPSLNSKSKMQNDENQLPKLKLVGGSR